MFYKNNLTSLALSLCIFHLVATASRTFGQQAREGQPLGSTLSVEELQGRQRTKERLQTTLLPGSEPRIPTLKPAKEPISRFQHRFYPSPREVRSGSGAVHFARAVLLFHEQTDEFKKRWMEKVEIHDPSEWDVAEVETMLASLSSVFRELHKLALCDDLRWELSLRDVPSLEAYELLLPEVQRSRQLARLLYCDAIIHAKRGRIRQSCQSLQAGFRLAEFVGQGETLIQQFVSIAITGIMQSALLNCLENENFPNTYWALATIPENSMTNVNRAIEFELRAVEAVVPALASADRDDVDDATWEQHWRESRSLFERFSKNQSFNPILMMAAVDVDQAKVRLKEAGWQQEKLDRLPKWRLLAIDMLRDIRQITDSYQSLNLIGPRVSKDWSNRLAGHLRNVTKPTWFSPGNTLAQLFTPAVEAALSAQRSSIQRHRLLMTMEAVRVHAAHHGGKPPERLDELTLVPPMIDPFTGGDFDYRVQSIDHGYAISISASQPAGSVGQPKVEIHLVR